MVYRKQAREWRPVVRVVLRRMAIWWALLFGVPFAVSLWRLWAFEPRVRALGDCIDNCTWVEPEDLAEQQRLERLVIATLVIALGAGAVFAWSLDRSSMTVTVDGEQRIVRVSGRGIDESIRFAEAPALLHERGVLMLAAQAREPIVLARWHTPDKTVARLRAALEDATA